MSGELHWIRWRCCTTSGRPNRPWRPSFPPNSDPPPEAKAWNGFWPGCPTGGWRNRSTLDGNRGCNRRAPGEHGRTRLRECGAMYWAGCKRIPTPVRCHCWTGCKLPNRAASAGRICEHCSEGCSCGEASWPTSWSTVLRMNLYRNCGIPANSPWLEQEIRARISVTFPNEATGPARLIVVDHEPPAARAPTESPISSNKINQLQFGDAEDRQGVGAP